MSVGDDARFIIDDQYAPVSPKILAALQQISDKPIKFVLNTHWHGDPTGGHEKWGKTVISPSASVEMLFVIYA